jgi:hypothetical protein
MEQGEPCQHKPGCCAPECWCLKLPAVCMKCEHSLGSHSHFGVPEMSCTVVGCPCNPYRRASTTEPVAQPVPLSQGWVHDGDCALNPATGERVPYQAEPVAHFGNLLDQWDGMANDLKDEIRELEPAFYRAVEAFRPKVGYGDAPNE